MPESRGRKPRTKTQYQPRYLLPPTTHWTRLQKGIAATVTAIGVASAIVALLPRVTVEPGGQIDPSNPSPILFTIANTGPIPLNNVQPMLGICALIFGEPKELPERCSGALRSRLAPTPWFARQIATDERLTIRLDE